MMKKMGERIVLVLKQNKMSQRDLAKALGVSSNTVNRWIKKGMMPDSDKIEKIAEILNTPIDYLYGKTDDSTKRAKYIEEFTTKELLAEIERRCGE